LFFIVKIVGAIQAPLGFRVNFRISLNFYKNVISSILLEIALNLHITLGSMSISTTLSPPTYVHFHGTYHTVQVSVTYLIVLSIRIYMTQKEELIYSSFYCPVFIEITTDLLM
jgi:hypothetical protein